MANLLYVQASPLLDISYSIRVANAFVDTYRAARPGDTVSTLNVCSADLPEFGDLTARAKYAIMHGKQYSGEQLAAWKTVEAVIADFKSAQRFVFAVPMWNFGIPYRLKQYIDILVQPTYTFSYSAAEGYKGLVQGSKAFVAYARGGEYPEGTEYAAFDFQKRYLELILRFIGIADVQSVVVEPTLMSGPVAAQTKLDEAIVKARQIAKTF